MPEVVEIGSAESLSAKNGRAFAGRLIYDSDKETTQARREAEKVLPKVKSAYVPSGKMTLSSVLMLLIASPLVLLVMLGIGVLGSFVCHDMRVWSHKTLEDSTRNRSEMGFLLGLLYDILLYVTMIWLPSRVLPWIGRRLKNRNAMLPCLLVGGMALLMGVAFFLPWVQGETIASTRLSVNHIPLRWFLIAGGLVLAPFYAGLTTYRRVVRQKFCEETGLYLKPVRKFLIDFDYGENALELLNQGKILELIHLPKPVLPKSKHHIEAILWWEKGASVGFFELTAFFHATYKPKNEKSSHSWLISSLRLDGEQAALLQDVFPAA